MIDRAYNSNMEKNGLVVNVKGMVPDEHKSKTRKTEAKNIPKIYL